MATADDYAKWIVANKEKKGTPEFDTVRKAYELAKSEETIAPVAVEPPSEVPKGRKRLYREMSEDIPVGLGDVAAGALRGAGSIGATLLRPFESAEENQQRREQMDAALRTMGADPTSGRFQLGKIGGEIAGTAGIGNLAAIPLRAAAGAVPYLGNLANAVTSGGFQTGLPVGTVMEKGVNFLTKLLGGGIAGGAAGGMINPEEAGTGAVIGAAIPTVGAPLANYAGRGIGWAGDLISGNLPKIKAGKIAREALGPDLAAVQNISTFAPSTETFAQSTAGLNNRTWQALNQLAAQRDPNLYGNIMDAQAASRLNALTTLAEGGSQTATRDVQKAAKTALNKNLIPTLETELNAANIAGRELPRLEGQATRMSEAAANKVQDVRRFTAAAERADQVAPLGQKVTAAGQPIPARYSYVRGELPEAAERVAKQAAEGSLRFGEAARLAQYGADSLAAHGLKPLTSESIVGKLTSILDKPEYAGNKDLVNAVTRVADDIGKWTNFGGVIDAFALDSIRKNSVNAAIRDMYPAATAKQQKELTAKVLTNVKPLIVNAIEEAGGTGYGAYLKAYEKGMNAIDQGKMAAKALEMYQSSPDKFVKLVEGNSPKDVEKVFGPGSYNIAKEMSDSAMGVLKRVAGEVKRDKVIAEHASKGQEALVELLESNISKFRMPSFLNPKVTTANKALEMLESKIGKKTMDALTEGLKSGNSAQEILGTLPLAERNRLLQILRNPESWGVGGRTGIISGSINALSPDYQNALAQ